MFKKINLQPEIFCLSPYYPSLVIEYLDIIRIPRSVGFSLSYKISENSIIFKDPVKSLRRRDTGISA